MNDVELQHFLAAGLSHHQAGRLAQAETIYRQVLAARPDQPDALHLLGVIAHQTGKPAIAIELISRAVARAPTFGALNNLGEAFRAAGRMEEAVACYRRSIQLNPNSPDAYANLALVQFDQSRFDDAAVMLERACQLAPLRADYHIRLCLARQRGGDPYGAAIAGRRAVEIAPRIAEGWSNLALALASTGKHSEALEAASRAVRLSPAAPEAYINLGFVHDRAGRHAQAEAAYRKAIELRPESSLGHRNLAALLDSLGQYERAIPPLEKALALNPRDVEGWNNLSTLRRRVNDIEGALGAAEKALALQPGHPAAHGNRALALLALGDYERGFPEYEWRWRCDNFTTAPRDFDRPVWDGSDPAGRTILVHTEQGFGDTIQFIRYVPMLAARSAHIIVEAGLPLRKLLTGVRGAARVIPTGVRPPDFDLQVPLLSLPRIFGTTLRNLPAKVPYLCVDPALVEAWRRKLELPGRKVGLVWAGNAMPDPARTCPPENLAPLAGLEGVSFVGLQKRDDARDMDALPPGLKLLDVGPDLQDFADTAAAMMNLDLIITIDTAAAHLAGALGRPTFTLLPWAADWRWLLNRDDSPWYPTMRLFRQPRPGDWPSAIRRVVESMMKDDPGNE